jgi:hypothetical protein
MPETRTQQGPGAKSKTTTNTNTTTTTRTVSHCIMHGWCDRDIPIQSLHPTAPGPLAIDYMGFIY